VQNTKSNRLIHETSTYLLQHAHNPVDWYPWGNEALQRSKAEDKPILLSVGYSACHWCHVMEHESFEDEETALLMNELFVCIKVDREERPDIDDIYMKAVQMLTGQGGWPMTVFLTPDLKPFFGGTYFPKEDRHGLPSFKRLLIGVDKAWKEQRENVEESATELTYHLSMLDKVPEATNDLDHETIRIALERLIRVFDDKCGGFGGAPKFPHTGSISLAMRHVQPHPNMKATGFEDDCQAVVRVTLDSMAYGGIHDQIGGGFARYAVDRIWLIPHFEKMLYDNALLCRNYLEGYQLTGREYWATVGRDILEFILREMTTPESVFYSSLDADSEGEEGKFYVWSPKEIEAILGKDEASWVCQVYDVSERGNFEHGKSVLHLAESPENMVARYDITMERFWARLKPSQEKLLAEREKRVRPGRDDKVLTSWNALMISAFVDGYRVLGDQKYLDTAVKAATFILDKMTKNGVLQRTYGRGHAKLDGYLDDYAYMIQCLLDLAAVDFSPRWYDEAVKLTEYMLENFVDARDGSFFFTSNNHESMITRTKSFFDGSTPSATSVATHNLLRLARLSGNNDYEKHATVVMRLYSQYFQRVPDQFSNMLCAMDMSINDPLEIVLVADKSKSDWQEFFNIIHQAYLPNAVILLKDINSHGTKLDQSPLIEARGLAGGKPTVYICKGYTCDKPINDARELKKKIGSIATKLSS
jgi:uncharacterized protein YyaL (SSP411 family)